MAVTADSVVVELEARTAKYEADVKRAADNFDKSMQKTSASADKAAADTDRAAKRKADAEEAAQRRIAEAAEKSRIRLEEASKRAAIAAERDANRKADREEAAANRASLAAERAAEREIAARAKADAAANRMSQSGGGSGTSERDAARAQAAAEKAAAAQERAAARSVAAAEAAAQKRAAADEAAAKRSEAASVREATKKAAEAKRAADVIVAENNRQAADAQRSLARTGNASRNLGRQIGDIGTGLATGQNPFFIIAQQSAQVADALADTGGKAAKVAAFFAGPWGAALLAGASALGILLGNALKTGESVDSLVKKLADSEKHTLAAAQADRVFATTQAGLEARIRKTTDAINDQIRALRTSAQLRNIEANAEVGDAQRKVAEANQRVADARARVGQARQVGTREEVGALAGNRANDVAQKELRDALAAQKSANVALNRSRVGLARENAERNATAEGRLNARFDKERDDLQRRIDRAARGGAQVGAATQRQFDSIEARRQAELERLADSKKKGPKGKSAETLAREAEAARVREVRNNEAYNSELETLNGQLIAARRSQTADADEIAQFERDAVAAELRKKLDAIKADISAKKYDGLQGAGLAALARQVAAAKNLAISNELAAKRADEIRLASVNALNIEQAQAQADLSIAETSKERIRLERLLIKLKYDEVRVQQQAALDAAINRNDQAAAQRARDNLAAIPGLERAENTGIDQRNRSRFEQYRRNLDSADALQDSIDGVKIQTLEAVTNELTNATKAALGLKGAFGDIVGELIKIGIQRRLIGPLADALFGKADGDSGSGFLGGLFNAVGGIKGNGIGGRASGGHVQAGRLYRINENGPELFQPAQSGKVYPTGALAARTGGNSSVVQPIIQVDARGAVMNDQFARMILARADSTARGYASAAGKGAYQASPSRVRSYDTLGT